MIPENEDGPGGETPSPEPHPDQPLPGRTDRDHHPSASPTTESSERGEWLRLVVAAIARRAKRPGSFTVFEIAVQEQLPEPTRPTLWGLATSIARQQGLIVAVAAAPSLRPRTSKSLVRVWVGARYAQEPAA